NGILTSEILIINCHADKSAHNDKGDSTQGRCGIRFLAYKDDYALSCGLRGFFEEPPPQPQPQPLSFLG
ncbi:hypothetical protein, partial [Helicobacter sp. UBA3407]|uniref:hypothetical protein n=1 Tax=Helicobacter sp. UBA3407 TaxID=1946588 RepID=UPI002628E1DF